MSTKSEDVIQLDSELVKIDSSNPWLIPGSPGESKIATYIANWLRPLGLEVRLEEVEPGRNNMIAILKGTGGGKSLCLSAHLDTVGYALWKDRALQPRVEGDRLYGLGADDDKAGCTAAMLAVKSVVEKKIRLKGDVWIALVIDEEGTSSGSMAFVKKYKPDAAIVMDGGSLKKITVNSQGFGWLDIIVEGKAAHGCAPEIGIDAIVHMAEVITRLHKLDETKFVPNPHPLNGRTVFHTGTISGGTDYATYPDICKLGIEIGTQPGETIQNRVDEIERIFEEVKQIHPDFKGRVEVNLARNPFEPKGYEDLWKILASEVEKRTGKPPEPDGANGWGDAALFAEAGIPTVGISAAGANFHAPNEWVSISELTLLVDIIASTISCFCA